LQGKSEFVALANLFLDLGTWCVTPFIGAGAGVAKIKIDDFRELNVTTGRGSWADTGTQTNFAWALHAGVGYKVTPSFALELSYRYLNVGNAQSGRVLNLDPTIIPINPLAQVTFHNIQSNDIILSARVLVQ
jgi:opacity protein-like surface antigen